MRCCTRPWELAETDDEARAGFIESSFTAILVVRAELVVVSGGGVVALDVEKARRPP